VSFDITKVWKYAGNMQVPSKLCDISMTYCDISVTFIFVNCLIFNYLAILEIFVFSVWWWIWETGKGLPTPSHFLPLYTNGELINNF